MPVTLADAILGTLTVKQMTDGRFSTNAEVVEGLDSSGLDVQQFYGGPSGPRWAGTSFDLGGVLGGVSATGGLVVSSGTITLPYRERANLGTFSGSSSHPQVNATDGIVLPRGVSLSSDVDASISLEALLVSTNGIASPFSLSNGQTINADAHNGRWHLGPVSENGNTVEQVTGVQIDFGIGIVATSHKGNYPDLAAIRSRRPKIAITFEDFDAADNFAASHTVMTSAVVYARKRSGATWVNDGTAQHVKFSFADGMEQLDSLGASQGENGTGVVTLYGETLTVSAASAIT